jgi:hypothetical protein
MMRRRISTQDIEWLIAAGLLRRRADGQLQLTEEGAYITGRLEPPPAAGKEDIEDVPNVP